MLSATEIGKAGEHRVVSELLLRGFRPLLSIVDDGVDVMIENGTTIQVKTAATKQHNQRGCEFYNFRFSTTTWGGGKAVKRRKMTADFAVCWGIATDCFYVLPRAVIGERLAVSIPVAPVRRSLFVPFEGRWDLLRDDVASMVPATKPKEILA